MVISLMLGSSASLFSRARDRDRSAPRWCPFLAPTPGPASRKDTLEFCSALTRAHKSGLSNTSLVVDVGTDQGTEAITARGFGHPVLTFECRGAQAHGLGQRLAFRNDSGLKLVHACVSDRAGLGTLVRAMDSSSMNPSNVEADGASWKRRREMRQGVSTESVPVMRLDNALNAESLKALGWSDVVSRVGFLKVDVQVRTGGLLWAGGEAERAYVSYRSVCIFPLQLLTLCALCTLC